MGQNGSRFQRLDRPACPAPNSEICAHRLCGALGPDLPLPRRHGLARGEQLAAGDSLKLLTVVEGLVALCTALPDGRRQLVSLATPGDVLCPLDEARGNGLWVEALAPSRLCELDLSARSRAIDRDPVLGAELFRIAHRQVQSVFAHLILRQR